MGCAIDLWTKHWIFQRLGNFQSNGGISEPPIELIRGVFSLETHLNEGALFGIGQGQAMWFAALSILAAVGVLWWIVWGGATKDRLLTVALGMILGGILGNLYDRLGLPRMTWVDGVSKHADGDRVYAVRDWLHFKIDAINFDWPIFNIADCLLVVGASLMVWHALMAPREDASETSNQASS